MRRSRVVGMVAAIVVSLALAMSAAVPAQASVKKYANCTQLNKVYKHGVGKPGAKDRVRGHTKPVTNFTRSKKVYQENKNKDRDKDGVACEKR